jgi:ribosomal protein L16 Arg81 hydroxylase
VIENRRESALAELLAPFDAQEFLDQVWTQKSLLIPGDRSKFEPLFSWQKLNELLNFHTFEFPAMRLALDEKVLDPTENQNFLKHCQAGATLIIDYVHKLIPEIAQFASALRYQIGHPVQMNLYCSMPGRQGFKCHYDTHDVFILQIDGTKAWTVFSDTLKFPLKDQKSVDLPPPDSEPALECILKPGDLLYIPRGHWHYAVATEQPSLHLTLGVLGKTGIDLLEWLVSELKQDEVWRRNLPLLTDSDPAMAIHQLSETLVTYLQHDISGAFLSMINATERSLPQYRFPEQLGFNIFPQGIHTTFQQPDYQAIEIQEPEEEVYIIRANRKEIRLKGIPRQVVDRLFNTSRFTGTEVASWLSEFDWEEISPLLTRLVQEGVLIVG